MCCGEYKSNSLYLQYWTQKRYEKIDDITEKNAKLAKKPAKYFCSLRTY